MIIKNAKRLIPVLIAVLLIVAGAGCTFTGAKSGTDEPSPLETKIEAGLSDPSPLVRQAWSMIRQDIQQNESTSREIFGDEHTRFTDAEITTLELSDSFGDICKDAVIEVYLLEYRLLPEDMSKIMLAGGADTQDGWLLSRSSMGNPYLVAKNIDGERTYLGTIYPEGQHGVLDATFELLYRADAQDGASVARSPIEISRVQNRDSSGEADSDTGGTDTFNNTGQQAEPAEVQFIVYPSGPEFIKSVINQRGSVEITAEMRESFNLFARDYRWCYMPDMDGYESFFETTRYADSFGYSNFADAVFYVLQYMRCPEKMSSQAMQNAINSLFVAKYSDDKNMPHDKDMPHQAYRKIANYENGYYSPWPEGGLDHNRMFYLLTAMDIVQEGAHVAYITVRAKSYYFNDPNVYEAGEKEKWLAEKVKELEIPDLQAAAKLIASGEMGEIEGGYEEFETTIYVKFSGRNPYGFDPRFVSSRSRYQP